MGLHARQQVVRSHPYSPWQHLEFWWLLRREPPAIFHAPHFTTPLMLPRPTRLVVTIHDVAFLARPDLIPVEQRSPGKQVLYRLALAAAARRADVLLADTQAAAREVAHHLPHARGKMRVLSPGVDLARLAASRGDARRRDAILFAGTVTARKGVHELLRAFAGSRAAAEGLHLVIVGPNGSAYARAAVRLAGELGLAGRVTFTGAIPDDALLAWYGRARAAVLPSFLEGFGYPVVEAMAAGVPCVASALPAIEEVAGGAALLVPPGDVPALSVALDRACFDGAWREAAIARGQARAASFSLERMGAAALQIYKELLDAHGS